MAVHYSFCFMLNFFFHAHSLVLMLRLVNLRHVRISSSSRSLSTRACRRYGMSMHGRTPREIACRLSLIRSHSSSSPMSLKSGGSYVMSDMLTTLRRSPHTSVHDLELVPRLQQPRSGKVNNELLKPDKSVGACRVKLRL